MSRNFVFVLILVYLIVGLVSFVSLLNHNFKTIAKNNELENKILETQLQIKDQELSYLKKQIHPHFLFNTLNTIYGFAIKQSKQTPEIILKLSNLLDYILYQVQKPQVSLKEEILHIKEYIDLEHIRFQDTLAIQFKSDRIPRHLQIPPMLLIPFVENAFKHGAIVNGFLTIDINIKLDDNKLVFSIENTIKQDAKESMSSGIGLTNIGKRLELLFKDNYELHSEVDEHTYKTTLTLNNLAK